MSTSSFSSHHGDYKLLPSSCGPFHPSWNLGFHASHFWGIESFYSLYESSKLFLQFSWGLQSIMIFTGSWFNLMVYKCLSQSSWDILQPFWCLQVPIAAIPASTSFWNCPGVHSSLYSDVCKLLFQPSWGYFSLPKIYVVLHFSIIFLRSPSSSDKLLFIPTLLWTTNTVKQFLRSRMFYFSLL